MDEITAKDKPLLLEALLSTHTHLGERKATFLGQKSTFSTMKKFSNRIPTIQISRVDSSGILRPEMDGNCLEMQDGSGLKNDHHQFDFGSGYLPIPTNSSSDHESRKASQIFLPRNESQYLMRKIPQGSESCSVQIGSVDFLEKSCVAFVRLANPLILPQMLEVSIPVRFIFILLGPDEQMSGIDYHEVGRAFSTLMSNKVKKFN